MRSHNPVPPWRFSLGALGALAFILPLRTLCVVAAPLPKPSTMFQNVPQPIREHPAPARIEPSAEPPPGHYALSFSTPNPAKAPQTTPHRAGAERTQTPRAHNPNRAGAERTQTAPAPRVFAATPQLPV